MSTAASMLSEYKARLAGLPENKFIGSILWFTVAGTVEHSDSRGRRVVPVRVNHDQLEAWFDELGLTKDFLPPRIKKVDAFRNASSQVRREYALPTEGQFAELLVVEVKSDAEQVIRHVMRQVRDERREKLSYDHMATLKFIRGGRTAKGKRHSGDHWKSSILHAVQSPDREEVEALIEEVEDRYADLSANLQSPAIRGILRSYLSHLNAIPMKTSGGVYFVHKDRQDSLDALQKLARRIGQGCSLEQFPLIDTDDSRNMLTDAFESEVETECRLLLKEAAELNALAQEKGALDARKYAALNARYQEVQDRSEEYTRLLGVTQGRAASALELALITISDMSRLISTKKARR